MTSTCLKRKDRPLWAATNSLRDVGELTAQWLEGRISSQPHYDGPLDTDERLAPGLNRTLAILNRAGFVTHNSQAGCADTRRYPNAPWEAWVDGFADERTYRRLVDGLHRTRFRLCASRPSSGTRRRPVGDTPVSDPHSGRRCHRGRSGFCMRAAARALSASCWTRGRWWCPTRSRGATTCGLRSVAHYTER